MTAGETEEEGKRRFPDGLKRLPGKKGERRSREPDTNLQEKTP